MSAEIQKTTGLPDALQRKYDQFPSIYSPTGEYLGQDLTKPPSYTKGWILLGLGISIPFIPSVPETDLNLLKTVAGVAVGIMIHSYLKQKLDHLTIAR